MPTSRAKIEANRSNALRSTGPRTAEGKARSSMNALKHGLLSPKLSLIFRERPEDLVAFHDALYGHLDPVGALEEAIVHRIISRR